MKTVLGIIKTRSLLILQMTFVTLSFALMVIFSYMYVSRIEREQLHRSANNALNYSVLHIEADLRELETTLIIISETIRQMIMDGADEYNVSEYLVDITNHLNENRTDSNINGTYGYFNCFNNQLFTPPEWNLPEDFDATAREWYRKAVQARGKVVMIDPYVDAATGAAVITYTRRIFNDEGTALGVIGIDIDLERVSHYAVHQEFAVDAYGILFDSNLEIIAHPSPAYLGRSVYELNDGETIAAEFLAGKGFLSERPAVSYKGEPAALFYMQLDNGWVISMIAPYNQYYRSTRDMAYTLTVLGLLFAAVLSAILISLSTAKNRANVYSNLMFQALPLPCILWNGKGELAECNQETLDLFKIADKQAFLNSYLSFLPDVQPDGKNSIEAFQTYYDLTVKEGICQFEWLFQTAMKDYVPCEVTLVGIPHNKETVIIAYVRDMREYKAYLAEIHRAQEGLRHARDSAEAANYAKSVFLANMSHEIRTPLNSIIGFSELALDDNISAKTKDYLSKILENGEWLLDIVNDILDITKIESGKMTLERIHFNPADIITQCEAVFKAKTEKKGISFYCHFESSLDKELLGDPARLRQALSNLLSNAVKFTENGTIKFLASDVSSTENKVKIKFVVKDTGIGIDPARLSNIFEPFVQADDSITRKFGGTGLGLTITRNIVEMMGGKLEVDSKQGSGTKFSFDVTFDVPDGTQDRILIKELERPSYTGEVLICEDNIMNRQVICGHLERIGITSVIAVNGREGVDIVETRIKKGEKPFDLIFMDINMPVMDGMEAAQRIAELGVKTPIIAMTANIMPEDLIEYQKYGMNEHLQKPFSAQDLWKCLRKHFKKVT